MRALKIGLGGGAAGAWGVALYGLLQGSVEAAVAVGMMASVLTILAAFAAAADKTAA
ncbi:MULTISPECIES: hypothetical protein [unclassified Xanthobacter]|uniref:hypothetical protein n=1 Tax=unclassified Xanthobacter TaxID=2623496 RepID=UPI001F354EF4|nr:MULTISPECIES: hypothetical protein [unclassified Xanthobacter]